MDMEENFSSNGPIAENKIFGKTFFWMFLGLLGSAIVACYTYYSGLFIDIVLGDYFNWLLILELVVVLVFSLLFRKMSPTVVGILYFVYAMINGVTLSVIFAVFELSSILYLFVISALIYGVLGLIGYNTKSDLTSWSPIIPSFSWNVFPCLEMVNSSSASVVVYDVYTRTLLVHGLANRVLEIPFDQFHCWLFILLLH